MYILNVVSAIKKMTVNELRDFIFENYYKRIGFVKESSHYSMKRLKRKDVVAFNQINRKIADPRKAKEQTLSIIFKKTNTKSVKQSKIITQQPKTFENPNIIGIKLVNIEHTKTSHKLSKTIRQAEKVSQVGSNSSLYNDTKKLKIF